LTKKKTLVVKPNVLKYWSSFSLKARRLLARVLLDERLFEICFVSASFLSSDFRETDSEAIVFEVDFVESTPRDRRLLVEI